MTDAAAMTSGVFRIANFRKLWASNLLGDVGAGFADVALAVTAVQFLHATTFEAAIVAGLERAAYLILGIPIGVWVDRLPQRRLLFGADLLRFAAAASIPVAFWVGHLTVVQLMIVALLIGIGNIFYDVTHTTVLPEVVGRGRVHEASARMQTVDSTASVIMPGASGWLIAVTAAPVPYIATAAAHLLSTLFAARITAASTRASAPGEKGEPFFAAVRTGIAFIGRHALLRAFMAATAVYNFGAGIVGGVFAVFFLRTLHQTSATLGLMMSIAAIGGIVGAVIGLPIRRRLGEVRAQFPCYALMGAATAFVPLSPYLPWPPVATITVAEFFIAFAITVAAICSSGVNARMTPAPLLGRVTSARRVVSIGAVPLGTLAGGIIGSAAGADTALWVGAAAMLCSLPILLASPARRLRDLTPEFTALEATSVPA
ncbi:MFS transporter [Gryllotalpicola koreensis]|uniref:MFS transporter n=1 Tax=Gryllotalpicola koreensis TaxID=993086 RepID=A0ABP7ZTZ2_9MICO